MDQEYYIFPQLHFSAAVDKKATESLKEKDGTPPHRHHQVPLYKKVLSSIGSYLSFQASADDTGQAWKSAPPIPNLAKVAIIGVHGWFPARWLQLVVGEPTGTSQKFCSMMDRALHDFCERHFSYSLESNAVTLIPLVAHGVVAKRVENLWQQLVPYADTIREADCILWVTHSQGTPVSVMLLAKLLEEEWIRPRSRCSAMRSKFRTTSFQRIGLMAMAGIGHGPIPAIKHNTVVKYFEQDAARELFEFCSSERPITTEFCHALHTILERGVLVLAGASWYDQVVPLYSALLEKIRHPNLWRCLYISAGDYKGADDFLTNLLHIVIHLLNVGVSDCDLIACLSDFAAGSMYSGTAGHSTIYEEPMIYEQMLKWLYWDDYADGDARLSTAYVHPTVCADWKSQHKCTNLAVMENWSFTTKPINPYVLPVRLLELLKTPDLPKNAEKLYFALKELIKRFPDWHPEDKLRQELVYRLEGIAQARL